MALIPVLGKQASGSLCVPGQPGYIVRVSGKQTNIKEKKKETCFISIPFGFSSDLLFKVDLNRKAFVHYLPPLPTDLQSCLKEHMSCLLQKFLNLFPDLTGTSAAYISIRMQWPYSAAWWLNAQNYSHKQSFSIFSQESREEILVSTILQRGIVNIYEHVKRPVSGFDTE